MVRRSNGGEGKSTQIDNFRRFFPIAFLLIRRRYAPCLLCARSRGAPLTSELMVGSPFARREAGAAMALRTFTDRDDELWNAWHVIPNGNSAGYHERYREGWVCFERVNGGGRCRLPLSEMPPGWESLPDDRLDLIRRVASASSGTGSIPKVVDADRLRAENEARQRTSGPRQAVGPDEESRQP